MSRVLPLGTGLAILLSAGVVHGLWTQRWQPSHALQAAAARMDRVPLRVGEWQGRDVPMDAEVIERAGLVACWTRHYVHERTGRGVTVVLMCGRAGPTSVHTPEWCYGGAGYERVGATVRQRVGGPTTAEFWAADFRKHDAAVPAHLRIFWGWSPDGTWSAPNHPRLTFARHAALYKLYALRETTGPHEPLETDDCLRLLDLLLPMLVQTLFTTDPDGGA